MKNELPPKYNNWLSHPLQQQLQSNVCDNWQWVFIRCGGILAHSSLQNQGSRLTVFTRSTVAIDSIFLGAQ